MTEKTGYDALMHRICVGLGFCGSVKDGKPIHVSDFIPDAGIVAADQFVEWVFLAENMNPTSECDRMQGLKGAIRAAFVEHMGGELVEAKQLRWSDKTGTHEP